MTETSIQRAIKSLNITNRTPGELEDFANALKQEGWAAPEDLVQTPSPTSSLSGAMTGLVNAAQKDALTQVVRMMGGDFNALTFMRPSLSAYYDEIKKCMAKAGAPIQPEATADKDLGENLGKQSKQLEEIGRALASSGILPEGESVPMEKYAQQIVDRLGWHEEVLGMVRSRLAQYLGEEAMKATPPSSYDDAIGQAILQFSRDALHRALVRVDGKLAKPLKEATLQDVEDAIFNRMTDWVSSVSANELYAVLRAMGMPVPPGLPHDKLRAAIVEAKLGYGSGNRDQRVLEVSKCLAELWPSGCTFMLDSKKPLESYTGVVHLVMAFMEKLGWTPPGSEKLTVEAQEFVNQLGAAMDGVCAIRTNEGAKGVVQSVVDTINGLRNQINKPGTKWVRCAVCGEPGMRWTPDGDEGSGYITCVNLACGSNGGANFSGVDSKHVMPRDTVDAMIHPLDLDVTQVRNLLDALGVTAVTVDKGLAATCLSLVDRVTLGIKDARRQGWQQGMRTAARVAKIAIIDDGKSGTVGEKLAQDIETVLNAQATIDYDPEKQMADIHGDLNEYGATTHVKSPGQPTKTLSLRERVQDVIKMATDLGNALKENGDLIERVFNYPGALKIGDWTHDNGKRVMVQNLSDVIRFNVARLWSGCGIPQTKALPNDLRIKGWMVGVHNDYRQDGEFRTFWLLTRNNKECVVGEGKTDAEALESIRDELFQRDAGGDIRLAIKGIGPQLGLAVTDGKPLVEINLGEPHVTERDTMDHLQQGAMVFSPTPYDQLPVPPSEMAPVHRPTVTDQIAAECEKEGWDAINRIAGQGTRGPRHQDPELD